ncbi:Enriched in surface-labeled proteome protein 8 [Trypanosoma equiperdum]|uniref:Uncharacterized protein n=1 Tax=Trypanosoma equiperdum TaxID=5694 RepID=A0A1G4IE17_TRYEQ|nr:Enriched in surface-labeled proteome protein 8 [Trypanosoma equiperdum]
MCFIFGVEMSNLAKRPMSLRKLPQLLLLIMIGIAFVAVECIGAPVKLPRRVDTVAGQFGVEGETNGYPNTTRLTEPYALCRGRTNDEILVGSSNSFRNYSRKTKETGTYLRYNVGDSVISGSSTINKPRSCVRRGSGNHTIIYFVDDQKDIKYIVGDDVSSFSVPTSGSLNAVAVHEGSLYVTDQNNKSVWKCGLGGAGKPQSCEEKKFTSVTLDAKPEGIAVTSKGIFVTARDSSNKGALLWLDMSGSNRKGNVSGGFVDVFSTESGVLYAATEKELYTVTATDTSLSVTLFAGKNTSQCYFPTNGEDIVLCDNSRLLVIEEYEMYVTSKAKHTMRALTLPPVNLTAIFRGRPAPVGYPNTTIMEQFVASLTEDVNKALGTNDSYVDPDSVRVDPDTWETNFTVFVQQTRFDNTTEEKLRSLTYTQTDKTVDEYYGLTDEYVYIDTVLVPFCDDASLVTIQRALAREAGRALNFSLVYADKPITFGSDVAENVTAVKLLMPHSFKNATTPKQLSAANLTDFAHNLVKDLRASDTRVDITFPDPPFNFSAVVPEREQEVRWFVHGKVMKQLEICERLGSQGDAAVIAAAADATARGKANVTLNTSGVKANDTGVGPNTTNTAGGANTTANVVANGTANVIVNPSTNATPTGTTNASVTNTTERAVPVVAPTQPSNGYAECRSAITNRTETQNMEPPYDRKHRYEVFLPKKYDFNVSWCVDIIDWRDLDEMLNNRTDEVVEKSLSWCGHGCIIAFAVVGSLIAACLVVLAVVLTSKRRRLAAVVAPPRPKFVSTVEDDDEDRVSNIGVPLTDGKGTTAP